MECESVVENKHGRVGIIVMVEEKMCLDAVFMQE